MICVKNGALKVLYKYYVLLFNHTEKLKGRRRNVKIYVLEKECLAEAYYPERELVL